MITYLDSSALFKLYVTEANSEAVNRYVKSLETALPFSQLHELEVKNAFRLKKFRREASHEKVQACLQLIEEDLASGVLQKSSLTWADVFRRAEQLSAALSAQIGCRALDLLHVASALLLEATEFLTFDGRQTKLAAKSGLKIAKLL